MKAMILAAGFGTRMRPLTDSVPKALVPIFNIPALEWLIQRFELIGVDSIAINTHYFAEQVESFVKQRKSSTQIELFKESKILGTGGGLLNTRGFWKTASFFLHNVDVFCSADLLRIYQKHEEQQNLATLLTQDRSSQTKLLVDEEEYVCGIHYFKTKQRIVLRKPKGELRELGFNGIHLIRPDLFSLVRCSGHFSIIDSYLALCKGGSPIRSFDIGDAYWKDIGTLEKLNSLECDWQKNPELRACYGK
ncbi:MAG: NTP transferase domain-containing protein [SAR324 cluster bacterium]|nr:NTP transferase domain-containing protein [SAR324 cluster bacterium]